MQATYWKIVGIAGALSVTPFVMAQGSSQNFSNGVTHSAQGLGESVVGVVQVSSAVVAIPLKFVGAIGHASGKGGDALLNFANDDSGKPLPVAEETVTAGPTPYQAMVQPQE
ncbi:MAG: mechanosensitive ion channel protein MscS [Gammaproteobacteria bacterium]|nr:mechanosensitive ion channel protein MscS [Gammaproteobacteria bacterium]